MRIEHLAIWTRDLERLRTFYEKYFLGEPGPKYTNTKTGFESYFLTFSAGMRLEIMRIPHLADRPPTSHTLGLVHFAVSTGSRENVDALTERLRADGYRVLGEPRTTGDGYYESVIADPDGNRIELTA